MQRATGWSNSLSWCSHAFLTEICILLYMLGCELKHNHSNNHHHHLHSQQFACVVKLLNDVQVSDVFQWTQSVAADALWIQQEDGARHRPGHAAQDERAGFRRLLAAAQLLSPGRRGGILRVWPPDTQPGVWGERSQTAGRPGRFFPAESLRERDALSAVPDLLPGAREGKLRLNLFSCGSLCPLAKIDSLQCRFAQKHLSRTRDL